MSKFVILFVVAAFGCAGCQRDDLIPISPESTTADKLLEQDKIILPMPAEWLQKSGRLYLPHDFVLKTPNHGAQLWPTEDPNLVLWGSPILPGMASIELPPLPFHKFRLFVVARTRWKGQLTQPCIVVQDRFDGKALATFQPNGEFRTMQSPILFTRSKTIYFVYLQGSHDDEYTNIDVKAIAIIPVAMATNE